MIDSKDVAAILLAASLSFISYRVLHARKSHPPYPPGPPPKPLIGNAYDIPFSKAAVRYMEWSKQYNSDIIHLSALNTHIVVLHKMEDVVELMERRSANYSSRPSLTLIKLLGMENITPLVPYGNTLRKQRRILEEGLRKDLTSTYRYIHLEKVHILLGQFLSVPDQYKEHCKLLAASDTVAVAFGHDLVPGQRDEFLEAAEFVASSGSKLFLPGRTLLTVFGFLSYIPPWFPGASTQKLCAEVREAGIRYRNGPFQAVKQKLSAGTLKDCVLRRLLERHSTGNGSYADEETMKDVMATFYIAGVETLKTSLLIFILAMTLHPAKQQKAQEEIDRVVGSDRLPTFEDRASLPYVDALYREVLRWQSNGPLGLVHATSQDDIYKGYYIPKGSLVMANVWAITRDEERYPDPESFLPERFLGADGRVTGDTFTCAFGFGRRVCPGRYLADELVWIMAASVLATFKISKAKDENGNEIDVDPYAFTDTVTSEPLPFKCSIVPRSQQAESLIKGAASLSMQSLKQV